MQTRATSPQSRQPFYDRAQILASGDGVEEMLLADQNAFGQGDHWFLVLDGLTVARRRYKILRDFDRWNEQEAPALTLRFCLQGGVEGWMQGSLLHTRPGEHDVLYTPGRSYRHVLRSGSQSDIVEVYLTQEYVAALIERHPEVLETYFAPISRQEPFRLHPGGLPLRPQMRSVIHQLLGSRTYGSLRRLFVEAKIMELLVLQLQQHEQREVVMPGAAALSKRDVDRMIEARDRVLARMDDPPTLAELAHQVGTNEFALKRDFKAVFGTTVYGLLLAHKLEYARLLLLETVWPIGEVAREVGYSHGSHFSTAFKKKYGVSPSSLRRA